MASDRRRGFEAWARAHGDPAVRAGERRAIAEDLFEVARDRDVRPEHVEELTRRYRERFAGAQRILLTQQIAEEIFAFQAEPRAAPPRAPDARREDDEVIGIALDPISAAGIEMVPPRAADAPPAAERPPVLAIPPAPTSSPDRPRTGAATGWAAPQRGTTGARPVTGGRADDAAAAVVDQGLWAPLREATPAHPAAPPAVPPPDLLGTSPREAPPLTLAGPSAPPPPRAVSSRPPPPPATSPLGRLEVAGLSSRPPPAPAAPPPAALPPPPALPTAVAAASHPSAGPLGLDRRKLVSIGASAAAVLFLIGLVVTRPSCIFPAPTAEVKGRHTSEHLGVALTFPEPWMHEGRRDEDDRRGAWERASSVFFQGVSVDEFAIQLTVVTLAGDRPATEDDLRSVGSSELAGAVVGRKCGPYDRYGTKAVRCTGLQTKGDRRFAMLEEYFTTGGRIVYARGLVETVSPAADEPAPAVSASPRGRGAAEPGSPLSDLDAKRLETILDSVEALP